MSAALCEHETKASGQRAAKPASIANRGGASRGIPISPLRLKPLCSLGLNFSTFSGNGKTSQLSVRCGFELHALRRSPSPYAHRVLHSLHPALSALVPYPHRNHRSLCGPVSLCSLRVRPARLSPLGLTSYSQSTAFAASGTAGAHSVLHWQRVL